MKKNTRNSKLLQKHARVLVESCATIRKGERVLLIFDGTTRSIEPYLLKAALSVTPHVVVEHMTASIMHCIEPPENVVRAMAYADVILALTKYSLAHTTARFQATKRGARYLSLPDYSVKQLLQPSLSIDFHSHAERGKKLKRILDKGTRITIRTKKGTNLELAIQRRIANWAPGFCDRPGMLGSPPDIETNIAPIETKSNGVIVVDGSIPCESIGLLSDDLRIVVKDGKIATIGKTKQGRILKTLIDFVPDPKRRVLAEFGIGLNPAARLCGLMLEDEGCLGTVHFGFGSNATIGGKNKTAFHLDMVIRKPTVEVDGVPLMREGKLLV